MKNMSKNKLRIIYNISLFFCLIFSSLFLIACNGNEDDKHNHSYENFTIAASCDSDGYIGQKCKTCNNFNITEVLPKLTHSYIKLQKNPDCENDGYIANVCENCGHKQATQSLSKYNHRYVLNKLVLEHSDIKNCGEFVCELCDKVIYKSISYNDVNIPILSLNGSMDGISKENKINISVSYDGENTNFECDATLKWQGGSSIGYDKKNYNIQLLKTGTKDKNKVKINEDWGKQSKYTLKANWIDFSQMRNVVSGKIFNQIVQFSDYDDEVVYTNNGGVVDGFPILIYHNGNYLGLYTLNIPKDNWMWGMDDDEEDDDVVTKQASLSVGSWDNESFLIEEVEDFSSSIELEYCSTEDTIGDDWVLDSFNEMIRFINTSSNEEFKNQISNYVNVRRTIDSMIYTNLIVAADNVAKNILWLTYDGVHWFSSVYDMDGTWGLVWDGLSYYEFNSNVLTSCNKLWQRLLNLYQKEIALRYFELRTSVLTLDNIKDEFESFNLQISDTVRNTEIEKWQDSPSKDTNNLEQIINFAEKRLAFLDSQMLKNL